MKYGVLITPPIKNADNRSFINLGDGMQAEAILQLYDHMGIARSDVVRISINDVNDYCGEPLVLPININMSLNWILDIFPMPPLLYPVFLGLSYFASAQLPDQLVEWFRHFEPIGCRDESTLELMRRSGIQAYLFGCITMTMRKVLPGNKIILADVPASVLPVCLSMFGQENCVVVTHIKEVDGYDIAVSELENARLLQLYRNAKLVVTSRLHSMAPCLAMGIPVVPIVDNISPRLAWIDRFLKIYTSDNITGIDWNGTIIDIEDIKHNMLQLASVKVRETFAKHSLSADLDWLYSRRDRACYGNYYIGELRKLPEERRKHLRYAIWGCGQIGMNFYQVMQKACPDSELVMAIDKFCKGTFFGVDIRPPQDIIDVGPDVYVFIATYSGKDEVAEYLKQHGWQQGRDFHDISSMSG